MAAYFLETSAAVKLYARERGSDWLLALAVEDHEFIVARITQVEIAAALYRRVRGRSLPVELARRAVTALRRDLETKLRPIELTLAVAELGLDIAERRGLRGYDCVQLASALAAQEVRANASLSGLILLTADQELVRAPREEGLSVENPNDHP